MTLRPKSTKWIGIGLICLVFDVIAILMIGDGQLMGWASLAIFGLGLLIALVSMLPNASYLQLTPEGFTMRSLYRSHFFRWKDVTAFAVGRVVSNKMVMFNFAPTYQGPSKFRSFNASLTGYEAGLPDSYGMSHEALADLLNQYKTASRDS